MMRWLLQFKEMPGELQQSDEQPPLNPGRVMVTVVAGRRGLLRRTRHPFHPTQLYCFIMYIKCLWTVRRQKEQKAGRRGPTHPGLSIIWRRRCGGRAVYLVFSNTEIDSFQEELWMDGWREGGIDGEEEE